jgi:hypothetical protein
VWSLETDLGPWHRTQNDGGQTSKSLQGDRRSIISLSLVPPYHCESTELLGNEELELGFIG